MSFSISERERFSYKRVGFGRLFERVMLHRAGESRPIRRERERENISITCSQCVHQQSKHSQNLAG